MQSVNAWMEEQLAKIDRIECEAWDAWERSKLESVKTRQSKVEGDRKSTAATVDKEAQNGDPRYLSAVMSCIERRSKLLGLDAPSRQELTGAGGAPIEIEQKTKEPFDFDGFKKLQREIALGVRAPVGGAAR